MYIEVLYVAFVSRFTGLAKVNATDCCDLSLDALIPTRGNLWPYQPDQTRAVSVPSNIAEGQGRLNPGEFQQFLGIARGSLCELQTQLEIARVRKFGNSALIDEADQLSHEVGKMIYAFLQSIKDQLQRTEDCSLSTANC
jgi:four helix bundle protein